MNLSLQTGRLGRWFALGLLAVVLGLIWIALAEPTLNLYESRAENANEQIMIARRMHVIVAELPQLERQANAVDQSSRSKRAFIEGATAAIAGANLEQILQTMASQGGTTLSSGEILSPLVEGPYTRIQLRVSVSGSWPALMRLLQTIGANQPILLVDDLQISSLQDLSQPGNANMDADFTVIAFRTGTVHPKPSTANLSPSSVP